MTAAFEMIFAVRTLDRAIKHLEDQNFYVHDGSVIEAIQILTVTANDIDLRFSHTTEHEQ